ncbi:XrtA-associated tyrosine autokinase [Sulfurimicrobium lacus]|uniref:XrtA-associated tyrosine autokinase n=1 Tax=Sulfurimicrobium lacus TaxID=2715678 RepID=UPI0015636E37|nr:XrtA-associated tyrosine autokinase [Sulfurimicrobium lacus]
MSIIERAAGKIVKEDKTSTSVNIIEKAAARIAKEDEASARTSAAKIPADHGHESVGGPDTQKSRGDRAHSADTASSPKQCTINLAKLRQSGIITPDAEKTQIAEEFRLIKRPLIKNAFQQSAGHIQNGNLIMVTSALAGEGKTFCSINLAMSIAMEMDHTVLLIDADVARPSLPNYLGLQAERGLLDVLLDDKLELADVMIKTNVDKLSILTAGKKSKHATELLASQSMSELLKEIAHRYSDRIVIFDSPPLLLTSEARVLASQMGQIVLVVAAEKTPQQTVKEALRQIESCDVVNLIYNKASTFPGGEYYGYYS